MTEVTTDTTDRN